MVLTLYELEERKKKKWYMATGVICLTMLIAASIIVLSSDVGNKTATSLLPRASESSPTPTPIILSTPTYIPVDHTMPSVSIVRPITGDKVTAGAEFESEVTASDNDRVQKVEFYANDILRCRTKISPYICRFHLTTRPNFKYDLRVKAYDMFENSAEASLIFYTQ